MAAIELDALVKRYGNVEALRSIMLAVEEGEVFGVLGPNGAGKSTMIAILVDFVRPSSGSATVLGNDAQAESLDIRRRTGVLPDDYPVYDRLTGRQHVMFMIDSKDVDDDSERVLQQVGILSAADRKACTSSKGMKQRLMLAMALVGDPALLLLDEPSTGLDPNGAREMRNLIRISNDCGTTIFFSSHILEQVEAGCDRVGILHHGHLTAVDTIDGLRQSVDTETVLRVTIANVDDAILETVDRFDLVRSATMDGNLLRLTIEGRRNYRS